MKRLIAAAFVAVLVALATAPSAWAHAELVGSDPGEGSSVAAPERITLTFSQPIPPDAAVIFVTGADGVTWWVGDITANGDTLAMPVTPAGPAGPCKIYYEVVADGDPVSGEVTFTLAEAVPAAASTPPVSSEPAVDPITGAAEPGGLSGWTWVVVAAVSFGLVVGIVLVRVGRARPSAGPSSRAPNPFRLVGWSNARYL